MTDSLGPQPSLTVVLAVDTQRARCERALESVLRQSPIAQMEVLLLDIGRQQPPLAGSDHPAVRTFHLPKGLEYGTVMVFAVAHARAPVVAMLEEHAYAQPGWAAALLRAHEAPWAAVGPQVGTDAKLGRHDLIELVSSGPWSVPAQRGEARILRWQNVAYKRDVLLRQGARLGDLFCAEGTFFQLLRAQGERLYVEPEARIIHSHEMHLAAFLLGNTYSSRLTAARRARLLALSPLQRLLRAANALLTPLRSLWQLRRRILAMPAGPERAHKLETLRRNLGTVWAYYCIYAGSAILGTLFGEGQCARRFLDYELNGQRDFSPPLYEETHRDAG